MKRAQQLQLRFYEQLILRFGQLTEPEKQNLLKFERKRPTSEWPGWKRKLGDPQHKSA